MLCDAISVQLNQFAISVCTARSYLTYCSGETRPLALVARRLTCDPISAHTVASLVDCKCRLQLHYKPVCFLVLHLDHVRHHLRHLSSHDPLLFSMSDSGRMGQGEDRWDSGPEEGGLAKSHAARLLSELAGYEKLHAIIVRSGAAEAIADRGGELVRPTTCTCT